MPEGTLFLIEELPIEPIRGTNCMVVEDLDGDGRLDLAMGIVLGSTGDMFGGIRFMWGEEDGSFSDEMIVLPAQLTASSGCVAMDWDEDGSLDLLMGTYEGELAVFRSTGKRTYEGIADLVEYPDTHTFQRISAVAPVDLDGKPPMDLFVTSAGFTAGTCKIIEDPGDGTDIQIQGKKLLGSDIHCLVGVEGGYAPAPEGLCPNDMSAYSHGPVWSLGLAYLNHDLRPDVVVINDFTSNRALLTEPDGSLKEATAEVGIDVYNHGMGIAVADFDGDGAQDLYITDLGPDQLWKGDGCGGFSEVSFSTGIAEQSNRGLSWGVQPADIDLDGDVDIFVSNSMVLGDGGWADIANCGVPEDLPLQSHFLFMNDGTGKFTKIEIPHVSEIIGGLRETVVIARGDLDRDGDVDFVTMTEGYGGRIYWNQADAAGHWLSVRPQSESGVPVLGTRVTVVEQGGQRSEDILGTYGTDGHSALEAYFGLGSFSGPVTVKVRWPDGKVSVKEEVSVNQHLVVTREGP
jgi:hypothetical protein